MDNQGGVVVITIDDIYRELVGLRSDVGDLSAAVKPLVKDQVPDHERRIRVLEKLQYAVPPGFLLALLAAIRTF